MDEAKTLELLGLTKEQLQERVLERMVEQLCDHLEPDIDISGAVRKAINDKVDTIAAEHVVPNVGKMIDNVSLKKTNEWGEKKDDKTITFIEYLTERAEKYLQQPVDYSGTTSSHYSYKEHTRLIFMIDRYIGDSIGKALKGVVGSVNKALIDGLVDTIKLQLAEVAKGLELGVVKKR